VGIKKTYLNIKVMKPLNDYQKKQVRFVLSDKLGFDLEDIVDEAELYNDLGMDMLDTLEIIMELEKIFNIDIPDSEVEKMIKVLDIYNLLVNCN